MEGVFAFSKNASPANTLMGCMRFCVTAIGVAFFGGAASAAPLFYFWEERGMELYKGLYYKLFGVIADAVESLEQNELLAARKALIAVIREAEETVVSAEE